jgi:hypothetical protein
MPKDMSPVAVPAEAGARAGKAQQHKNEQGYQTPQSDILSR